MTTAVGLCLPLLLLLTLLPAGLAYNVFRAPSSRAADPSSGQDDDADGGSSTWQLCESMACSHLDALARDACLLQCVYVLNNYGRRHHDNSANDEHATYRRQLDNLQSCIEAKCSGGNWECIYQNCIDAHRLGMKMKDRSLEDTLPPAGLGLNPYGQQDIPPNELTGVQGIYGIKRGGIYGIKRGGTYGSLKEDKRGLGVAAAGIHKVAARSWGETYITCLQSRCQEWEDNPTGPAYNECASLCKLT